MGLVTWYSQNLECGIFQNVLPYRHHGRVEGCWTKSWNNGFLSRLCYLTSCVTWPCHLTFCSYKKFALCICRIAAAVRYKTAWKCFVNSIVTLFKFYLVSVSRSQSIQEKAWFLQQKLGVHDERSCCCDACEQFGRRTAEREGPWWPPGPPFRLRESEARRVEDADVFWADGLVSLWKVWWRIKICSPGSVFIARLVASRGRELQCDLTLHSILHISHAWTLAGKLEFRICVNVQTSKSKCWQARRLLEWE